MSRDRALRRVKRSCAISQTAIVRKADAEAARVHWAQLPVDDRLEALRFEDPLLVHRLCFIRQVLCASDLKCYMLGVRGQDSKRAAIGVDDFGIECSLGEDGNVCPESFFAKRSFVERSDLFELMEQHLGSPLLRGRPALKRRDWPSLVETDPSSWAQFMCQILRLVELAIFQKATEQHKEKSVEEEEAEAIASALALQSLLEWEDARLKPKPGKRRKKRGSLPKVALPAGEAASQSEDGAKSAQHREQQEQEQEQQQEQEREQQEQQQQQQQQQQQHQQQRKEAHKQLPGDRPAEAPEPAPLAASSEVDAAAQPMLAEGGEGPLEPRPGAEEEVPASPDPESDAPGAAGIGGGEEAHRLPGREAAIFDIRTSPSDPGARTPGGSEAASSRVSLVGLDMLPPDATGTVSTERAAGGRQQGGHPDRRAAAGAAEPGEHGWLSNGLAGDAAEWFWTGFNIHRGHYEGLRVVIKNTFLEARTATTTDELDCRRRSRSLT